MPLTIDGSPVREVTIDGSLVRALTIDGSIVFDTVDSFEDGDISEYALSTGDFSVQSTTTYNGGNALKASTSTSGSTNIVSTNFSVSNGNTYRCNGRFSSTDTNLTFIWGTQDETSVDGYGVFLEGPPARMRILEISNGSLTQLAADTSVSYTTGIWYTVEFDWGSSGGLTATLIDDTGSQVSQLTATDSTYTSGGIGWRFLNNTNNAKSGFYDWHREV